MHALLLLLALANPALADEPAASGWDALSTELDGLEPAAPAPKAAPTPLAATSDAAVLQLGASVYRAECATCHGVTGDGRGPAARYLRGNAPTSFQRALFKWRSTLPSSPPLDADLVRTIRTGLPGTAMPAWQGVLSDDAIDAVVQYIKTLSNRWEREKMEPPVAIPPVPENLRTRAAQGREGFALCASCHGEKGRGDGPAMPQFVDNRGKPIRPADFTKGVFKGGSRPEEIFRTITTGIEGTPMPSFASVSEDARWDLVAYVLSLESDNGKVARYLLAPVGDQPYNPREVSND